MWHIDIDRFLDEELNIFSIRFQECEWPHPVDITDLLLGCEKTIDHLLMILSTPPASSHEKDIRCEILILRSLNAERYPIREQRISECSTELFIANINLRGRWTGLDMETLITISLTLNL